VSALVSTVFSERTFLPWLFDHVPSGYFERKENQRSYVAWLRKIVGLSEPLKTAHFEQYRGKGLLWKYNGSVQALLRSLESDTLSLSERGNGDSNIPNSRNEEAIGKSKARNYWSSMENQRRFMADLAAALFPLDGKTVDLAEWYRFSKTDVVANGGSGLLKHYNGSYPKLLSSVFPEYPWQPWRFKRSPPFSFSNPEHLKTLVRQIETTLGINSADDWYRVGFERIRELGYGYFFEKNGRIVGVLRRAYPEVQWDEGKFPKRSSSMKRLSSDVPNPIAT